MVWFNADSDTELEKSPSAKGNATPTVNQFRACSLPLPNTKGLACIPKHTPAKGRIPDPNVTI